jgi:hypothetical protein
MRHNFMHSHTGVPLLSARLPVFTKVHNICQRLTIFPLVHVSTKLQEYKVVSSSTKIAQSLKLHKDLMRIVSVLRSGMTTYIIL